MGAFLPTEMVSAIPGVGVMLVGQSNLGKPIGSLGRANNPYALRARDMISLPERLDLILMRLADIQLAIPSMVLYIAIMVVLGPGLRNLVLGLGLTSWVVYARVVRSQVLSTKQMEFVIAARAIGARDSRTIFLHLLPNVIMSVIVIGTIQVAGLILAEGGLSFLGLGIPPPTPTWGSMVADGRDYVEIAWWIATLPGLAILFAALGINLFGDWLRDYLDPRLRE